MTFAVRQSRWRQLVRSPLVIALVVSLLLHLLFFLLAWVVPRVVESVWFPPWMKPLVESLQRPAPTVRPPPQNETVTEFVEVNPDTITPDAPEEATKQSNANTLAANPDPSRTDQPVPNIDGKRPEARKTFDTSVPPTPVEPPPKPAPDLKELVEKAAAPPPGGATAGETTQAKVVPTPKAETQQALPVEKPVPEAREEKAQETEKVAESKPRKFKTLSEARAAKGIIVEEKKKQEGGVRRLSIEPSENVKASPFGDYGLKMTAAIQARWYELLDERKFSFERSGQVEVTYRLHADGHVSGIENKPSSVGENLSLICILSIDQAAPFGTWPVPMRSWVGKDFIDIKFTFNYIVY
jgi:hypothetical protein